MKKNLRRIMQDRDMNPARLAVALQDAGHEISYAAVIGWYYGYRTPTLENASALASVLGVTVEELTTDAFPVVAS